MRLQIRITIFKHQGVCKLHPMLPNVSGGCSAVHVVLFRATTVGLNASSEIEECTALRALIEYL